MAQAEPKNWGASWADSYIAALRRGETVSFRPHGRSMEPRIQSGALCTVESIDAVVQPASVRAGDIVLCTVGRRQYLHFIKTKGPDGRLLIGDNKGGLNGWIKPDAVHGKLVKVEP